MANALEGLTVGGVDGLGDLLSQGGRWRWLGPGGVPGVTWEGGSLGTRPWRGGAGCGAREQAQ